MFLYILTGELKSLNFLLQASPEKDLKREHETFYAKEILHALEINEKPPNTYQYLTHTYA